MTETLILREFQKQPVLTCSGMSTVSTMINFHRNVLNKQNKVSPQIRALSH